MLIDVHSHHLHPQPGSRQILALRASLSPDFRTTLSMYGDKAFLSVGIHPWDALHWSLDAVSGLMDVFLNPRVLLIGEIGLDKVSSIPLDSQKLVFNAQVVMAEQVQKPVLLHVVHAMSDILESRRRHSSIPAWIIHGFRGGKQESEQYIRKGFYLSFGHRFNVDGLMACPMDRLFLETDDGYEDLKILYERVAQVLQCSVDELEKQLEGNFRTVFMK
ncbi:MAG: TatD family hydrolase [Bacteroidales bacterium]|nr:TatD family hydrolase [Bacteroidales bacterium]